MKVTDVVNQQKSEERRKLWKLKGTVHGTRGTQQELPDSGKIKRYILTSAQNNTRLHDAVWESLQALAKHYHAEIFVGTFSYDQNKFGEMAVKRGKAKHQDVDMWYDERITKEMFKDERIELAPGLVWCGEMNILPTAVHPLASLESYTNRKSAIFPHAKQVMRSVPSMLEEPAKFNYTTGTITKRNYVQKRLGLIAE